MGIVIKWFINAFSLYIVSKILVGITVSDFGSALVAVLIIGLINVLIKPLLLLLTLPINLLTLGLFTFVINGFLLLFAGSITPGFKVDGLLTAMIASVLISIISTILQTLAK